MSPKQKQGQPRPSSIRPVPKGLADSCFLSPSSTYYSSVSIPGNSLNLFFRRPVNGTPSGRNSSLHSNTTIKNCIFPVYVRSRLVSVNVGKRLKIPNYSTRIRENSLRRTTLCSIPTSHLCFSNFNTRKCKCAGILNRPSLRRSGHCTRYHTAYHYNFLVEIRGRFPCTLSGKQLGQFRSLLPCQ